MGKKIELAWAAGFFDGEGCFHAKLAGSRDRKRILSCSISQVDREVLDRFTKAVGTGKVYGPYPHSKNPNTRPVYRYVAVREDAHTVAKLLDPYLGSLKKTQYYSACDTLRGPSQF